MIGVANALHRLQSAMSNPRNGVEITECTDLIIVCCHATFTGSGNLLTESQWILQDFQRSNPATNKPSEHETFIGHVIAALITMETQPRTVLLFSGGRTTQSDRTEAEGYDTMYFGSKLDPGIWKRCAREDYATDSYQNLLFSIMRFRVLTGRYPRYITVMTHAFKARRFLELHTSAIKWPPDRIRVQGINPPFTLAELQQTERGELERAHSLFVKDMYGVRSPLAEKRKARNWNAEVAASAYEDVEQEVKDLFRWDGGESGGQIFPGRLPWEDG